jgi:D-galactarolactone cycloisomerase
MRVVSVETFVVRAAPRGEAYWGARAWGGETAATDSYPTAARRRIAYSQMIETVLVRLETDDAVVGWGEAKAPVAGAATATIVDELLAPIAVGSGLDEIAVTWERMYATMTNRGHTSGFLLEAIAGVDIALWDAWGRALGQPIAALLGGRFRSAVPVYASGVPAAPASALDGVRERAQAFVDAGFRAMKVAIGSDPEADVASVRVVRDVLGDDGLLFADASGAYDIAQATWVGERLAELGAGFFEMPLHPEQLDGYARLARKLTVPLALDTLATRGRALEFLSAGALHVLQPDVNRAGGITGTMRIAALADAFGAQATPHVSIGSAVHFAASLQCALAIPNFQILEHWAGDNPLGRPLAPDLDEPVDGHRRARTASGIGVEIDEAAVRELAIPR